MPAHTDFPQNELESALVAGATDESARPRFYETLLNSQVFIVPVAAPPPTVDGIVQADTKLSLSMMEINGAPHVPFFSSETRLAEGTPFIGMAALDFLKITLGSSLILNPGSSYGKAFLPAEVASLLDGSMFKPSEKLVSKGGEQQLIGQPKDYPHEFASAISRFFASEPSVEMAFLAQHYIAGMHTQPALLVAVIAPEQGFERIAGSIGIIAKETKKSEGAVDVTRVQKGSLGYFSNQEPIYTRKKKGLFQKLFG